MEITIESIKRFVFNEILVMPELSEYKNYLNVYLTGSRASGGYSDKSDIDLDILCPQDIYEKIQERFFRSGKTHSIKASFYTLTDIDYQSYFGDIGNPHFSISPQEKILSKLREFDEVQMWIWSNAKIIINNGSIFNEEFFIFPKNILIEKLKKYYMDFLYNIIDVYPSHEDSNEMKHIAVYSIYNSLINLYRFSFLAEGKPFPYTEKLVTHIKTTKFFKELADVFQGIYSLLENISGADTWDKLERCRGMLCYDDKYESAAKLSDLMDKAMLENGCEAEWVAAGYDNIDDYLLSV